MIWNVNLMKIEAKKTCLTNQNVSFGIDWKFSEMLKIQWFTIEKMIKKNYEGRDLWET